MYDEGDFDYYLFDKNLQGDIVGIYNKYGTKICSYTYDAWGEFVVETTASSSFVERRIAEEYNPFRYRGYYYDVETRYYYLQTRYYNPAWGRFINPDSSSVLLASPSSLTDKNLYAYCDNNPIIRMDDEGEFWHILAGAAVGSLIGGVTKVITNVTTGKNWSDGVATAMAFGALSGALVSSGLPAPVIIIGSAFLAGSESMVTQSMEKGFDNIDYGEVAFDAVIGGVSAIGAGIGSGNSKHMMRQGVNATKRLFRSGVEGAGKAAKYYFSQTSKMFYKPLLRSILPDITKNVLLNTSVEYGRRGLNKLLS